MALCNVGRRIIKIIKQRNTSCCFISTKSNVLLISPNSPPSRAGSCATTFARFIQKSEDKVWGFVRAGNKAAQVAKTISMEERM